MSFNIANVGFFTLYQILIIISSIRFVFLITSKSKISTSKSELIIYWISVILLLNTSLAGIFSFTLFNGEVQYLISSLILVFLLHMCKKEKLVQYKEYVFKTFEDFSKSYNWKIIIAFAIVLPIVIMGMRPIDETDSIFELNYILEWVFNHATPYYMLNFTNSFWQSSFVPSLVLSHSDHFFWINSVSAVILIALTIYLVGKEIRLPKILSWFVALSSFLFFELWVNPSGAGTLKEDTIFAVGVIMLVLASVKIIKSNFTRQSGILLVIGSIFALTKYVGIAIFVLILVLLLIFNWKKISKIKHKITVWGSLLILIVLATSANYYVQHMVVYGDPLYPYTVKIFGLGFNGSPGTSGYKDTSIISSINDIRVWHYFVLPTNILSVGILFPAVFIFGLGGSLIVIIYYFRKLLLSKKIEPTSLFLAIFIFITWIIYFCNYASASNDSGKHLEYLIYLHSLRYVEGTLFLTELFMVYVFWKSKIPLPLILSIVGIDIVSKLIYLYSVLPSYLNYTMLIFPIGILIIIYFTKTKVKFTSPKLAITCVILISVLILSPQIVETERTGWAWPWKDVVLKISDLPPSKIVLLSDSINSTVSTWPITYFVYGNNLQHSVTVVSEENLTKTLELNAHEKKISNQNYVVLLCDPNKNCRSEVSQIALRLSTYGYSPIEMGDHAMLLNYTENRKPEMISYFKFGGIKTSLKDFGNLHNDGVVIGQANYVDDKFGKVLFFNGNSHVVIPNETDYNFDRTDSFSIVLWYKSNFTDSDQVLLSKNVNFNMPGFHIRSWISNTAIFRLTDGKNIWETSGTSNIKDNKWHQVVVTYSGNGNEDGMKLYVDGKLESIGSPSVITGSISNHNPLIIGSLGSGSLPTRGLIDQIRIYKNELSPYDVWQLYSLQ